MALELTGKLVKILPEITGQGKNGTWMKQEFIVETFDQYPKKICLSAWGDKVADLKQYAPGDVLKLSLNLESREYNDRWFTEARAWRIETGDEGSANAPQAAAPRQASGNSSAARPAAPSTPPYGVTFDENATNDLPF
jgi:hypothetical protein